MNNKKSKNSLALTFVIKITFLIILFVGIPYFLVSVLGKYQQKATGIIDEESAVLQIQTEKEKQMKVLTQVEANTLSQINDFIGGTWVSERDGRYKIQIDLNNKFSEYYDDTKEGFGVWRVFAASQNDVDLSNSPEIAEGDETPSGVEIQNTPGSNTVDVTSSAEPAAYTKKQFDNPAADDSKYFFQKQQYEPGHKGEQYVYQIQQLDTDKFILVYKGGTGRPLVFVRFVATSSLPTFSH